jgi:hypothetical protein
MFNLGNPLPTYYRAELRDPRYSQIKEHAAEWKAKTHPQQLEAIAKYRADHKVFHAWYVAQGRPRCEFKTLAEAVSYRANLTQQFPQFEFVVTEFSPL